MLFRAIDGNNYWTAQIGAGLFTLNLTVGGSVLHNSQAAPSLVNGNTYVVQAIVTPRSITATLDGANTLTFIDSGAASAYINQFSRNTRVGLHFRTAADFSAGNLAADGFSIAAS